MPTKYAIYLIISSLINLINNSEIIIPFTSTLSEIPKNLTPFQFMYSLFNNELYIKVKVGTPPQDLDLIISFEYYHIFLIKDSPSDNINHKRFYSNISSTFKNLGNQESFYSDTIGFSRAINSSDLFTINENITNFNFTFLQVTDSMTQIKIKYPGVLGLNVISNGEPFHLEQGLVYQLKAQNYTNNYLYTFSYNNNDDFKGNIIFEKNIYEEYPLDNYSSCYCYSTPDYTFYWESNYINSFYYYKTKKATLGIKNLLLKPELGVVLFNKDIEAKLKEEFLDDKIKEGKCYEGYSLYTFYYCDIDVKIDIGVFEFKKLTSNFYFSLNSDDLTLQYNNKKFLLMGFSQAILKEEAHLGYPFFRKYDVIFDQNKRTYRVYNFKIGKKSKEADHDELPEDNTQTSGNNAIFKIIVIVLLTIIFLALILLLAFYIFRNIKRKEKSKLLEELNEIN